MANVAVLVSVVALLCCAAAHKPRCPEDYRYRVETCVMEAQVAPQAGGGLPLVTDTDKLEELCERGILQKTIDCLRDIHTRCAENATQRHELDMLFSLDQWKQGQELLCEDLNRKLVFKDHFECVSRFGPRISSCILTKTQNFRKDITDVGRTHNKTLHNITCNFAEDIVYCLERPLARACPIQVVETMVSALHKFLPPACAPVPTIYNSENLNEEDDEDDDSEFLEAVNFDAVIVEGGDPEN
ncbi:uncharacterized protein LOC131953285 isoform X1 [Physella acuta]|uniref:uncharacterized protein LOC131953285 isoform X1 n=1 Tax=Physella acuta TaxID=109671 RepID=UPI0027DE2734|nr:uncharacterized protein LOC131953285 isoform X1 [Physella acuta]